MTKYRSNIILLIDRRSVHIKDGDEKMRVVKEHDERKQEIIDTANRLFSKKGYSQCSINDILNEIGIAKGTFYHYFRSKEDVLDAVIGSITREVMVKVNSVASNEKLRAEEKLLGVFLSMRIDEIENDDFLEDIHKVENALMHQKSLASMVKMLTPVLTEIVLEGITEGVFRCKYPKQYIEIFLASSLTLLDGGIFEVDEKQYTMTLMALISLLEKMLEVEDGAFTCRANEYICGK